MKQLRSRFRLISLLLVCAFLLTLALCTGTALRQAGISLSSLPALPKIGSSQASPDPSDPPAGEITPAPSATLPADSPLPMPDISPDPEYNVFGL